MVLRDLTLKQSYRSGRDSPLEDFYVPCLQEAMKYDRAVGYFSSTLVHVVAIAFSDFARRGGKMRLICSPSLTIQDFEAMQEGQTAADLAQDTVKSDIEQLLANPTAIPATRLLATLISTGIIDVRIAFTEKPDGLFHDKLGIFEDADGKRVTFHGSANETWRAWGVNHESFSVFASWANESELIRTREHADVFSDLWYGREATVKVAQLRDVTRDRLREISETDIDEAVNKVRASDFVQPKMDGRRQLMPHQIQVLDDWEAKSHRGIVNFATGAGKTMTAIHAMKRWSASGRPSIVIVPGKDLHEQWIAEIESELPDAEVLPAGAGHRKEDWVRLLSKFTSSSVAGGRPRIVVATNATFASTMFQSRLRKGRDLLLVADEMHRTGSAGVLPALEDTEAGGRLGLSATYRRQFDEDGTSRLEDYFGPVLEPIIGLAEAVSLGLLVPYDYWLHEVSLTEDELTQYDELTKKIQVLSARGESVDNDGPLRFLLIRRAKILKQASQKVPAALNLLLKEFQEGDRWLVYCDDVSQLDAVVDGCLRLGLPAMEFHSGMASNRADVLQSLGEFGGIVVAIKCLDEGIDVPVTDHALILASSTVEREYIQRRGRVLRRAPEWGKVSAEVHDLILVDSIGGALTKGEAIRALEFSRLARNESSRDRLKSLIALSRDSLPLPQQFSDEEESHVDE